MGAALRLVFVILAAALLAGCTPPPPAFTGPVAVMSMTSVARGSFAEDVFYVSKINGQPYLGQVQPGPPAPNMPLNPVTQPFAAVDVPAARPVRFTLVGHSVFQAPIFGIAMADYSFTGDTSFTPAAGGSYIVKGVLTPDESRLWIEDLNTGKLVAPVVAFHGSTAVPLVKKTLMCNPSFC